MVHIRGWVQASFISFLLGRLQRNILCLEPEDKGVSGCEKANTRWGEASWLTTLKLISAGIPRSDPGLNLCQFFVCRENDANRDCQRPEYDWHSAMAWAWKSDQDFGQLGDRWSHIYCWGICCAWRHNAGPFVWKYVKHWWSIDQWSMVCCIIRQYISLNHFGWTRFIWNYFYYPQPLQTVPNKFTVPST